MNITKVAAAFGLVAALAACEQMPTLATLGGGGADAAGDACGAAERQAFVGQSVAVLNEAELPENRRILFPGMAATMDFVPERLNVEVGGDDEITRVYCG